MWGQRRTEKKNYKLYISFDKLKHWCFYYKIVSDAPILTKNIFATFYRQEQKKDLNFHVSLYLCRRFVLKMDTFVFLQIRDLLTSDSIGFVIIL